MWFSRLVLWRLLDHQVSCQLLPDGEASSRSSDSHERIELAAHQEECKWKWNRRSHNKFGSGLDLHQQAILPTGKLSSSFPFIFYFFFFLYFLFLHHFPFFSFLFIFFNWFLTVFWHSSVTDNFLNSSFWSLHLLAFRHLHVPLPPSGFQAFSVYAGQKATACTSWNHMR